MDMYKGPIPNQSQLKYLEEELACFMHFGMNTYTDKEWGDGKESLDSFKLENFDFDSYVSFIKEAGFKRLVFTAKHHDGFCLFDSKYTDHKVTNTKYGKDFLLELSKACTKYDMNMGIYLSPWDAHEESYGTGQAYNDFYLNQIIEICENPAYGNKGKFVEWWFDNAKDPAFKDQEYDFDSWIAAVEKHNPGILMFGVGSRGGIHWPGNEKGYLPAENSSRIHKSILDNDIDFVNAFLAKDGHDSNHVWSVAEGDTPSTNGWFYHDDEIVKPVEELKNIYLRSVGRGGVLLLNIAPDKKGSIPQQVKNSINEFLKWKEKTFAQDINDHMKISSLSNGSQVTYKIENQNKLAIQYIEISEDISKGSRFIRGYLFIDGERINIESLGRKRIINLKDYGYNSINHLEIYLYGIDNLYIKEMKIYRGDN